MTGRGPDRAALAAALLARYPWLDEPDTGPRAVEAGECDRCGAEARLVETCGPVAWQYLGRQCARELGYDSWCSGHTERARAALAWLAGLPREADAAARLWWVSTGEVTLDPALLTSHARTARLPADTLQAPVRRRLEDNRPGNGEP